MPRSDRGYAARVADRVDANGVAYAGSQLQTQLYVNKRTDQLDAAIRDALDELSEATFEWRSPLADDHYAEYWDAAFLKRLHLDDHVDALAKFWAKRGGPHWDALALVHLPGQTAPGVLLAEGKSYPAEMLKGSGLSATDQQSTHTIEKALAGRRACSAFRSTRRLDGPAVPERQPARPRLLAALPRRRAWLVHLLFADDPHGPTTADQWMTPSPKPTRTRTHRLTVDAAGHVLLPPAPATSCSAKPCSAFRGGRPPERGWPLGVLMRCQARVDTRLFRACPAPCGGSEGARCRCRV